MSDGIALVRTFGALLTVLGLLAGALWVVRRYNLVLPGSGLARLDRRLAVIERLGLDPRRSLLLIRRDDIEHLVMLSPEGNLVIESSIAAGTPTPVPVGTVGLSWGAPADAASPRATAGVKQPLDRPSVLANLALRAGAPALATRVLHNFCALIEQTLCRVVAPQSAGRKRGRAGHRWPAPHG